MNVMRVSRFCPLCVLSCLVLGGNPWHCWAEELVSPDPAKVVSTVHTVSVFPFTPSFNKDKTFHYLYGRSNKTRSVATWVTGNPPVMGITQNLYRESELININSIFQGQQVVQQIATIATQRANRSIQPPTEGEVFMGELHFPLAGCFDGWFLEDYFPPGKTSKRFDGEGTMFSAHTKYGKAQAWIDPQYPRLPARMVVTKSSGDLASANRVVGEFLSDPKDENSMVLSIRHEFSVTDWGRTDSGEPYYKVCELVSEMTSKRGKEGTTKKVWSVEDIDFDPDVHRGSVYPKPKTIDREAVKVKGAEQIPYVWSSHEQWAVPDHRFLAPAQRWSLSRWRLFTIMGIVVVGILVPIVYLKWTA